MSFTFLATNSANSKWNELFKFVQDVLKENEELKEQNRTLWKMCNRSAGSIEQRRKGVKTSTGHGNNKNRRMIDDDDEVTFLFEKTSSSSQKKELSPPPPPNSLCSWDEIDIHSTLTDDNFKNHISVVSDLSSKVKTKKPKSATWSDCEEMKLVKEENKIIENSERHDFDVIEEKEKEEEQEEEEQEEEEEVEFKEEEEEQEEEVEIKEEEEEEEEQEEEEQEEDEQEEEVEIKEEEEEQEEEEEEQEEEVEIKEEEEEEQEEEEVEIKEEEEEEQEEDEVEEIIYQGKKYYKDGSNTIYAIDADEEVGAEIGKFNPQTQTIEFTNK